MAPEPPPLDLKALELEFYSRPDHAHLKSLQTLHEEAQLLLYRTLEELRAFVMAKDDEVGVIFHILYYTNALPEHGV